jgi:hypothetical protein
MHHVEVDPNVRKIYDVYSYGRNQFINWKLVEWNPNESTMPETRERKSRMSRYMMAHYNSSLVNAN